MRGSILNNQLAVVQSAVGKAANLIDSDHAEHLVSTLLSWPIQCIFAIEAE
jgi:DNA-binding FrmR family transcriptional regulator